MQRIMVVSDTHGRLENLAEALSKEGKLDMLIHLGDFEGDDEVICEMANCKVLQGDLILLCLDIHTDLLLM